MISAILQNREAEMSKQKGFFTEDMRLSELAEHGDPLMKLNELIPWENFRHKLARILKKEAKGPGGRPPYDYVMMFKILVLQRLYNLSDSQMQYQIMDRLSFMRFLGLNLDTRIPDEKTIWHFREELVKSQKLEMLFEHFRSFLIKEGVIVESGTIVDASFVEAPKQRNSKDDNKKIKNGETPKDWSENKLRQKDVDARWATKGGQRHYGYKNHIKIDRKSKIIKTYKATDAAVHDSKVLNDLLEDSDSHHELYADSAYSGNPIKEILETRKIRNRIHEKGYRGSPLTEEQKERNRKKSRIRARVEHVFGCISNSMGGNFTRYIGFARVETMIGLNNLVYNMLRYTQLCKA